MEFIDRQKDIANCCVDEHRQGPSFARNCGARLAKGDIVAFIDADCVADASWLRCLSESFGSSNVGAVAGSIIGFDRQTLMGKFHFLFTMRRLPESRMFHEFKLVGGGFPTANLAIRRTAFEEIGGFSEDMPFYAEDYDLCARIYSKGYDIYYNKEVIVFHQHRQDLLSTWRQSCGFGSGHAPLLKRHFCRMVIVEAPWFLYISEKWPLRAWVDIASADKKFILGLILSGLWWPFSIVLPAYLILLYRDIERRLKVEQIDADRRERWGMVFLLLFKSLAMTSGRLTGSLRYGVLCF
jgi:cellulose synthase/poly-beta-1,6-N-acetylglucosamine synthase-like glycosyltransferase